MKQRRSLLLLLALIVLMGAVWSSLLFAAPPQRTLDQHVYDLASQLKCPVCQHESVADSSAAIAEQMRLVIRQQIQAGMSDQQILQYFAAHYGGGILLTPPPRGINLLAWLMPIVMFLIGLGVLSYVVYDWQTRKSSHPTTVTEQVKEKALAEPEFERYRIQLEQELLEDDPLFGSF